MSWQWSVSGSRSDERGSCADEMWCAAVEGLLRGGLRVESRAGGTVERLGYVGRLLDVRRNLLWNVGRMASPIYAAAEMLWYLSGDKRGDAMVAYAPQYERFLDGDGVAWGAYGSRWAEWDQLRAVVGVLSSGTTRQAVVSCWEPRDLARAADRDCKDIPCTVALQFLLRSGALNCVCTMRSNDVWLGMPYDVFCFTTLQKLIADAIGAEYGWYQHQVGSLHLYDRDLARAEQALAVAPPPEAAIGPLFDFGKALPQCASDGDWGAAGERIQFAVSAERFQRANGESALAADDECDWLMQCVALTGMQHGAAPPSWLDSRLLSRAREVLELQRRRSRA